MNLRCLTLCPYNSISAEINQCVGENKNKNKKTLNMYLSNPEKQLIQITFTYRNKTLGIRSSRECKFILLCRFLRLLSSCYRILLERLSVGLHYWAKSCFQEEIASESLFSCLGPLIIIWFWYHFNPCL